MKRILLGLLLLAQALGANAAWPPSNSQSVTGGYYTSVAGTFPTCLTDATGVDCVNKSAQFYAPLTNSLIPAWSVGSGTPTFTRATTATVFDQDGVMRTALAGEARFTGARRVQNLYTGSASLATQGITTVAGTYVVSFGGTGTITFSGTATGSLVGDGANRKSITLTTTAGTLTSTVTGVVTNAQAENVTGQSNQNPAEYVDSATSYGAGVNGVRYFSYLNGNTVASNTVTAGTGAPITSATLKGYLSEGAATNFFLNSGAPATQTISLGVGTYTTWLTGTGSITTSAGTATATGYGVATSAAPNTITVTVAGTVVFTVAGTVTIAQVENTAFPTSYIATAGVAVARNADTLSYPSAGNLIVLNPYTIYAEASFNFSMALATTNHVIIGSNQGNAPFLAAQSSTGIIFLSNAGVAQSLYSTTTLTSGKFAAVMDGTNIQVCVNSILGNQIAKGAQTPEITTIQIGYGVGANYLNGNIRNVRIWQTPLPNATLQAITR